MTKRTPSVQTLGVEEGRLEVSSIGGSKECHLFSAGFVGKKNLFRYLSCQRTFADVELTFKIEFIGGGGGGGVVKHNMKENDREQELTGSRVVVYDVQPCKKSRMISSGDQQEN